MPSIHTQIDAINNTFLEKYLSKLKIDSPEIEEKLRKIFEVSHEHHDFKFWEKFLHTNFGKVDVMNPGENPLLLVVLNEYAKINDVFKRLRILANQQYFDENFKGKVADSLEYVLNTLQKEGVSVEDAQKALNRARFLPSLTAHPTNPNSVEYTKEAMSLIESLVANENVEEKLQNFATLKIFSAKKTQDQEIEEGVAYLNAIYDGIDLQYEKMQEEIDNSAYKELKLPKDMDKFSVWIAGDGDGNPNATEESLLSNIRKFKMAITERYTQDLQKITAEKFDFAKHEKPEDFIRFLQSKKTAANANKVERLIRKVDIFGSHFAKIDIRHEANDLMKVSISLLKAVGAIAPEVNEKNISNEHILDLMKDEMLIKTLQKLDYHKTKFSDDPKRNELVKRIFGRFKLAAKNSEMFEKIIIAEFKEPKQISAVLMMLKASGNKVCEPGSHLSIVPLAESKDDLEKLHEDITKALQQPQYLEHIKQTKKIFFMIAKSDTVRRNGVGAMFAQVMAVKNSIKSIVKTLIENGVTDIENYEIMPYNGGGHALQRGGGRITELASVYGRYALNALKELKEEYSAQGRADLAEISAKINISAPCLTTQGHQNGILYHAKEVAAGTMQAFTSQAFYAESRRLGLITDKEIDISKFAGKSEADLETAKNEGESLLQEICETAVESYAKHIGNENSEIETAIVDLFRKACWTSTTANNNSSRPSKRGGGGSDSLLKQRAIGVEKICAHSGTNLVSWFGWKDGLQKLVDHGGDLNKLYAVSKTFRDYMRSAAMSLYMTDFETSWNMMIDDAMPGKKDLEALSDLYEAKIEMGGKPSDKETMAFIINEAEKTKALVYEAMTGKKPEKTKLSEGLSGAAEAAEEDRVYVMEKFPEIQKEIDTRKDNCAFANYLQTIATEAINKKSGFDLSQSEDMTRFIKTIYCAADVAANAPLGTMLSLTKERNLVSKDAGKTVPLVDLIAKSCAIESKKLPAQNVNFAFASRLVPASRVTEV